MKTPLRAAVTESAVRVVAAFAALEDMGYETVFDAADPTAPILQIDEIRLA